MDGPNDPVAALVGNGSSLIADLREAYQHLVAANERLQEFRKRREEKARRER
ncbi:MAG TPA: hypothetical protein VFL93_14375 [Longimicrobiaceae bacterium]|nr:hypothetical protein [Longimicrobiaceae bacterium]